MRVRWSSEAYGRHLTEVVEQAVRSVNDFFGPAAPPGDRRAYLQELMDQVELDISPGMVCRTGTGEGETYEYVAAVTLEFSAPAIAEVAP